MFKKVALGSLVVLALCRLYFDIQACSLLLSLVRHPLPPAVVETKPVTQPLVSEPEASTLHNSTSQDTVELDHFLKLASNWLKKHGVKDFDSEESVGVPEENEKEWEHEVEEVGGNATEIKEAKGKEIDKDKKSERKVYFVKMGSHSLDEEEDDEEVKEEGGKGGQGIPIIINFHNHPPPSQPQHTPPLPQHAFPQRPPPKRPFPLHPPSQHPFPQRPLPQGRFPQRPPPQHPSPQPLLFQHSPPQRPLPQHIFHQSPLHQHSLPQRLLPQNPTINHFPQRHPIPPDNHLHWKPVLQLLSHPPFHRLHPPFLRTNSHRFQHHPYDLRATYNP